MGGCGSEEVCGGMHGCVWEYVGVYRERECVGACVGVCRSVLECVGVGVIVGDGGMWV